METVLVQINNNKAYKLLEDLEDLDVIRVLKKSITEGQKASERFRGKLNLSDEEYNKFQQYIKDSRGEWEKDF